MNYNNGIANYLTGPGGRFDLSDPFTQTMVRDVMGSPGSAPKYGVSLPEIFQLHRALNAISSRTPQPQPTTVADDLKMAALQAVQAPNAAPPQAQQMPPQGIQQAMPQAQMPQDPMDQGLGGMPAPAMDNAQFADGGIIAFADNGLVAPPPGAPPEGAMTSDEQFARILADQQAARAAAEARVLTQGDELAAGKAAREAAGIKGKLGEERLKKLEGAASKDAEAEARSERFALAKAGFEMAAAAAKPGAKFLGSAAQGATAGLTDYAASQEKLRTLQEKRDTEIANIQNLQRAEDLGFVKDASNRIEKAQDRLNDLDKTITATQTTIAGQMSRREGQREDTAAQTEGRQAQIASQERVAGMQIAAQRKLEEFKQAGNVDATMLADYNKAMETPPAGREAALKAWDDKYSRIQRNRARGSASTGAATGLAQAVRLYTFEATQIDNDTRMKPEDRARKKQLLREEYGVTPADIQAYKQTYGSGPRVATPVPGAGGSSPLRFDIYGNPVR